MSCGMARLASGESVPGFAAAPSSALIAADEDDREPEDEREREDREENEATGHAARGRPLGVVAGGQDDPAPVATNEVDR